jgi:hypothetical protein
MKFKNAEKLKEKAIYIQIVTGTTDTTVHTKSGKVEEYYELVTGVNNSRSWVKRKSPGVCLKVADTAVYHLLDHRRQPFWTLRNHYVPTSVLPNEGDDCLVLTDPDKSGLLYGWKAYPEMDFSVFFEYGSPAGVREPQELPLGTLAKAVKSEFVKHIKDFFPDSNTYALSSRDERMENWQLAAQMCKNLNAEPCDLVRACITHCDNPKLLFASTLGGKKAEEWYITYTTKEVGRG